MIKLLVILALFSFPALADDPTIIRALSTVAASLNSVNANLSTVNTSLQALATVNTNLNSVNTNIQSLSAKTTSGSAVVTTSASVALTSVTVIGSNANRKGFYLWNNSSNSAYCTFASTATSAGPTFILPTFTSHVLTGMAYTGPISCIRNAGSGTMTITEIQ